MPRPTPIPSELLARPFRRAEAEALGLSRRVLQGQRFVRLFDDVYATADIADDLLVRAKAIQTANPDAALSHDSAAAHYGLPLPQRIGSHVTVPRGRLRSITLVATPAGRVIVHETLQPEPCTTTGWSPCQTERSPISARPSACSTWSRPATPWCVNGSADQTTSGFGD